MADIVGYGDAYRTYLDQRLFGPLGMTSADPTFDERGVFVASSYVHATALDFAKFGLLYLRGGEWDGRQIISRAWAETAQIPLSVEEETGAYYSWQWWVTGDEYGTYWASGYEGQQISVVPALDALILRFGHTPEESAPLLYEWRTSRAQRARERLGAFVVKAEIGRAEERLELESFFGGHGAPPCRHDRRPPRS